MARRCLSTGLFSRLGLRWGFGVDDTVDNGTCYLVGS